MDFKDCKSKACGGRATARSRYDGGGAVPVVPIANQVRRLFSDNTNNLSDINDVRVNKMITGNTPSPTGSGPWGDK